VYACTFVAISGQSTYWNVVAVCSVPGTAIKKARVVRDLCSRFGFVSGSVAHGPSSIVWCHITICLKCIFSASSIWVQPVHAISFGISSLLDILTINSYTWSHRKHQMLAHLYTKLQQQQQADFQFHERDLQQWNDILPKQLVPVDKWLQCMPGKWKSLIE